MAGQKQPIELVIAKGAKHLTKKEIEQGRSGEVVPVKDGIKPPEYLTQKQKKEFCEIAEQLKKLKIMGETDVDALARYITSKDMYLKVSKKVRSAAVMGDPEALDSYSKIHDRYFRQVRAAANDLGLSISSRCRLVVPDPGKQEKPENKFDKFQKNHAG